MRCSIKLRTYDIEIFMRITNFSIILIFCSNNRTCCYTSELEPDGFFSIRSSPAGFKICPVRLKSGRFIFGVKLAKIRQKSGKKIDKNPVKSVRFIFDVKLTKIRQRSGKKPAEIWFRSAG